MSAKPITITILYRQRTNNFGFLYSTDGTLKYDGTCDVIDLTVNELVCVIHPGTNLSPLLTGNSRTK